MGAARRPARKPDPPGRSGITALSAGTGGILSTGPGTRRTTLASIAPLRNAGPAFAAVAITFDSDPEILAAMAAVLLVSLALTVVAAARLAANRPEVAAGSLLG